MKNSYVDPNFLLDIFLEETWKKIYKLEIFIESKSIMEFITVNENEVSSLLRNLHGMKGSASMMGYPAISETAHSAEDLFAYLREEENPTEEDLRTILQLLRMVCGYLKRELRSMETDDEVTGFGWAVVRRIKNFLANVDNDNVPEGPSYQIAYTRKGKHRIPFINFQTLIPQAERLCNVMSYELRKTYALNFSGEETEVPHDIYDKVSMAIIQLTKNSLAHGIEDVKVREAMGKMPVGEITIDIKKTLHKVYITFHDDGQGLNKKAILQQASERGLLKKPQHEYTEDEIFAFLFRSGFTTKQSIDMFSGRGIGLDVVKASIGSLGGTIRVESKMYMGTTVFIELPLMKQTEEKGMRFSKS